MCSEFIAIKEHRKRRAVKKVSRLTSYGMFETTEEEKGGSENVEMCVQH